MINTGCDDGIGDVYALCSCDVNAVGVWTCSRSSDRKMRCLDVAAALERHVDLLTILNP